MKNTKTKTPKQLIYRIASHFEKDHRTVEAWFRRNDPMLTHPETIEVKEKYYGEKNQKEVQRNKDRKKKLHSA